MLTITYDNVVAAVVKRSDIDAPAVDTFISTAQMEQLVQAAIQSLSSILLETDPSLLQGQVEVQTIANQRELFLPPYIAAVHLVGWLLTDRVVALKRASPEEWFAFSANVGGWEQGCAPFYRHFGDRLEFYPTPKSIETVRILYAENATLISGSDFLGTDNMQEYLILHVCSRVMQAQEKDDTVFLRSLADVEIRLRKPGVRRDKNALHTVRDVEGANVRARFGWL